MRKVIVASAVALMALAGQAVAADGIGSLAPQFGHVDYNGGDRTGSQDSGKDHLTGAEWVGLLLLAGGVTAIAVVATQHHNHDHGRSA